VSAGKRSQQPHRRGGGASTRGEVEPSEGHAKAGAIPSAAGGLEGEGRGVFIRGLPPHGARPLGGTRCMPVACLFARAWRGLETLRAPS
jgi:hypothetical protein